MLATYNSHDLKELHHVLGVEVKRDTEAKILSISQNQVINELLDRNKILGCRCSPTPLVPSEKNHESFRGSNPGASGLDHNRLMYAVGSIRYNAAVTRPDIPCADHTLARHMAGATKHWLAVQHVMR